MVKIAMFCGGHGGKTFIGRLARRKDVELTCLINGFDDGKTSGFLRNIEPELPGISDFRKCLAWALKDGTTAEYGLSRLLEYRGVLRSRAAILQFLPKEMISEILRRTDSLADMGVLGMFPVGSQLIYEAFLRLDSFQDAVDDVSGLLGCPVGLAQVEDRPAKLMAVLTSGDVLVTEAGISGMTRGKIRTLVLRPEVGASLWALRAIEDADIIVYAPGTQHSSLLPSYMARGIGAAVEKSVALKLFCVNDFEDADIRGFSVYNLVERAAAVMGEKIPDMVTHVAASRMSELLENEDERNKELPMMNPFTFVEDALEELLTESTKCPSAR